MNHVTVERRDIEAPVTQNLRHGIDFVTHHHKVAGRSYLSWRGRLEVQRRRHAHTRHHLDTHHADLFWPRDADAEHPTVHRAFSPEDLLDRVGVQAAVIA